MLCFVFAALVVLLDQFFKRWIVLILSADGENVIIPGILSLIYRENTGAAFSMLADKRWLLAGVAVVAAIILVFILLRYTEGFWGTLGLAAVLGGTVGNLIDRVFHGYVVDMFRFLFMDFAIFNIADIFITLGFATFCIHFIVTSFRSTNKEKESLKDAMVGSDADDFAAFELPDGQDIPDFDGFDDTKVSSPARRADQYAGLPAYNTNNVEPAVFHGQTPDKKVIEPSSWQEYYSTEPESQSDITSSLVALSALESLESELSAVEDLDVEKMLREYGFEEDKQE